MSINIVILVAIEASSADVGDMFRRRVHGAAQRFAVDVSALSDNEFALATDSPRSALDVARLLHDHSAGDDIAVSFAPMRMGMAVVDVPKDVARDPGRIVAAPLRPLLAMCGAGEVVIDAVTHGLLGSFADVTFEPIDTDGHDLTVSSRLQRLVFTSTGQQRAARVIVAEDAALIRRGLERLLADEGFDVLAGVGSYDDLIEAMSAASPLPDLLITDIRMPPTFIDEGLRAAALLRASNPDLAIMVLSQHVEPSAATLLLDTTPNAVGYLLKERVSEIDEFVDACRIVIAGGTIIDPIVTQQLLSQRRSRDALTALTVREREVLDHMAAGASNRAIAAALYCSDKTIESHVRSIFMKLDLPEHPDENRRVSAVVRWLAHRS